MAIDLDALLAETADRGPYVRRRGPYDNDILSLMFTFPTGLAIEVYRDAGVYMDRKGRISDDAWEALRIIRRHLHPDAPLAS